MNRPCQNSECLSRFPGPDSGRVIRKGNYFRRSDGQRIQRYFCLRCKKGFSASTLTFYYREKKRTYNRSVALLLCSAVSQRRAALLLGLNRKTIVRKYRLETLKARFEQESWLMSLQNRPLSHVQFDDLETSEHSKCKPLSVALAVEPKSRKILRFQISQMPAKGHLSQVARRKYGERKDRRVEGWNRLFERLTEIVEPNAEFLSDENPHYPSILKKHFPKAVHKTVKGRRGCIAGQGELKKIGFDPLFSLNHTCAMLRANMNRLFRKTWCTTKNQRGLADHLWLYINFHNQVLTASSTI